ncbi:hypothetical protein [Streptomyces sp. TRM70350]|uniref:hypothetical protein n=1 Tax=Streptomyces sp. TRM70350 TaxID=2856165 RepID=UPI001C47AA02|nr:hypothetical protein [Streptomyces sp. TRM70350]MBV7696327.1 hypothetical protein [Streptomyces sp. TRM70350]
MKKRSMLAIASLATGFVVAAVTPSHAVGDGLGNLDVGDTLSKLDKTLANENLRLDHGGTGGNQSVKNSGKQGHKAH